MSGVVPRRKWLCEAGEAGEAGEADGGGRRVLCAAAVRLGRQGLSRPSATGNTFLLKHA